MVVGQEDEIKYYSIKNGVISHVKDVKIGAENGKILKLFVFSDNNMVLAITNKNVLQITKEDKLAVLEQYPNFFFSLDDKQIGSVKLLQREKKSLVEIRDPDLKLVKSFKVGSLVTNACYSNRVLAFLNSDGQLILYSDKY